jgi:hypothetical protein
MLQISKPSWRWSAPRRATADIEDVSTSVEIVAVQGHPVLSRVASFCEILSAGIDDAGPVPLPRGCRCQRLGLGAAKRNQKMDDGRPAQRQQLNPGTPEPRTRRDESAEVSVRAFLHRWGPKVLLSTGDIVLPGFDGHNAPAGEKGR